jgi:catechol 2,3-dioxygenase-like lactoylglutathione lyase family enzyme
MTATSNRDGLHVMQLDHATIVTDDLETARRFFCDVVGLEIGPRPPFRLAGYWLYLDGRAVVHLAPATLPTIAGRIAPRIDHLALRIRDRDEWSALLARLHAHRIDYCMTEVPLSDEVQLFVSIAPGVNVEFVAALATVNS